MLRALNSHGVKVYRMTAHESRRHESWEHCQSTSKGHRETDHRGSCLAVLTDRDGVDQVWNALYGKEICGKATEAIGEKEYDNLPGGFVVYRAPPPPRVRE